MPYDKLEKLLTPALHEMDEKGTRKGREAVICGVIAPSGDCGQTRTATWDFHLSRR
jgi:hypothetical protein